MENQPMLELFQTELEQKEQADQQARDLAYAEARKPRTCEYCGETSPNQFLFDNNHHWIKLTNTCMAAFFRGNRRHPDDCAWFDQQGIPCMNSEGVVHEH